MNLPAQAPVSGLLKKVWDESERLDQREPDSEENVSRFSLILILGGAAIVLCLVVAVVAYMLIKRSEDAMSDLLAEKGASLLTVFESALRTGMRGGTGFQLQTLLQEMARSPDIEFVAVTMPDGVIIAHSDRGRIGDTLTFEEGALDAEKIAELNPGETEKWTIAEVNGKRIFLLYRHFTLGHKNWSKDVPEPTVFLGMDLSPFEITSGQNRTYVAMLSLVILFVGLACLLAISYAQRASRFKLGKHKAEGEVRRLEQEIRRQEKLAAVGTLAAGVAHEIRNPLSSIKGYATYFENRFPEGSDDRDAATVMLREVNRLNRVISDLLGLSAKGEAKLNPVDLEDAVNHVFRLLRRNAASRGVELRFRKAKRTPKVYADLERLSQALLNLCLNALDAMPNGGVLTVAISGGKRYACLIARDTGEGIPPELISKIFDPYFTTKGSGTGLGLPMVHKIIRAHNGEIDVYSRRSEGAIFRIWLPAVKRA